MFCPRAVTLGLAAVMVFGACSGGGDKKAKANKVTTTAKATSTTIPPKVAPLTGLPDASGASATRSALAVKVGNNPEARPQAGLEQADIVFEEVVEGGITRFMAVFNSESPPRIGPVRSVRAMDPNITTAFGGIFAYSGGTSPNVRAINSTPGVLAVNETQAGPAMQRDKSRGAPDNLYVIPDIMWQKGGAPVPAPPQFQYLASGELFAGTPAASAKVGFASGFAVDWTYDETSKTWKRSYGTKPFLTQSGQQVAPTNVVVLLINYPANSQGIVVGEGDAQIFSDGKATVGRWVRPSRDKPAELRGAAGEPIKLMPGRTWVELAKVGTKIDIAVPATTVSSEATTTTKKKKKK